MSQHNCNVVFCRDDFADTTGCLRPAGHLDAHICRTSGGGLVAWENDESCDCGCWQDDDGNVCIVYWPVSEAALLPGGDLSPLAKINNGNN